MTRCAPAGTTPRSSIEELADHRLNVARWMHPLAAAAPLCGPCWGASCVCGFVFDSADDAFDVWPPQDGRLRCGLCASSE